MSSSLQGYEKAVINAVQRVYPGIKCEGDSFHLFQAVQKKVQEHHLSGLYKNDIEVYDQVRLMMTPMFAPPQYTMKFWHEVIKPLITREELAPVMDYVERTWIGESVVLHFFLCFCSMLLFRFSTVSRVRL